MTAIKNEIKKIYGESIEEGIFSRHSFNKKIVTIWNENQSKVQEENFINLVKEVIGPGIHFVDFQSILKKSA